MAIPNLNPLSTTTSNILPVTGAIANVSSSLPFGIYVTSSPFLSGAVDQVAYTYKKLGGDVLDIELSEGNVYAAYEEAVLEYSYIVNLHQSKNTLSDLLGATTASFNQDGQIIGGETLSGSDIELRYPRFDYGYVRRISEALATETGLGGLTPIYSGSFATVASQQDYDLQTLISSSASSDSSLPYFDQVKDKRIIVRQVFFKSPRAMWRFYGYYGGFSVVGNLRTYGQYADDSTFDIVPVWQNKLQAMAYEDAIYTRTSHYSYKIKDNMLRLYPTPDRTSPDKFWIEFSIDTQYDPWEESGRGKQGLDGINNLNTLPFNNLPYTSINSMGKQWIRKFALAVAKEMLGQIRGKFAQIPIPGENITLNASDLLGQAKEEQSTLREELKKILDEMTYEKMAISDSAMQDAAEKVLSNVPTGIYVG